MTKIEPVKVECPNCGRPGIYDHYASANVTLNPTLKDRVMDGSLFVYECPNCGEAIHVEASCLYHDMRKQLLIQLSPGAEDADQLKGIFNTLSDGGVDMAFNDTSYEVRLVSSLNGLREKILIADDDLDDRIVEIIKIYASVFASNREDAPEFDDVSYMGRNEDGLEIGLFLNGVYQASAAISMDLYDDQQKKEAFTSRTGDDYIIDYDWAYEAMGLGKAERADG